MIKKRLFAVILCAIMSASVMTGCGKEVDLSESGSNGSTASESSEVTPPENVDIANFTAPEKGDTIIEMTIKDYGTVKIRLFPEYAEKGVENFVELAKAGYYDGLTFHRVIRDFMIQGGDPMGTGQGGESTWGGEFDGGTDPHLIHVTGALAYANSGSTATDGSQFYIVTGTGYTGEELDSYSQYGMAFSDNQKAMYEEYGGAPFLDGNYTVFGQVFDGLDVIFKAQYAATDANDKPLEDVIIESVKVTEYNGEDLKWKLSDYDYDDPAAKDVVNFTAPEKGEKIVNMKIKGYGDVKIKVFPEYAPKAVENFLGHAKDGYYDGLTFHRVINEFMIQGGDPNGDGTGGESIWGGKFDGGKYFNLIHAAGAIAYANSGSTSTNGSQFYIVTGKTYTESEIDDMKSQSSSLTDSAAKVYETAGGTPFLDGNYTVFGQVFDGLDIIFKIQGVDTDDSDKPVEDVVIESVTVEDYDGTEPRWYISDYDGQSADKDDKSSETSETENSSEAETTSSEADSSSSEASAE